MIIHIDRVMLRWFCAIYIHHFYFTSSKIDDDDTTVATCYKKEEMKSNNTQLHTHTRSHVLKERATDGVYI